MISERFIGPIKAASEADINKRELPYQPSFPDWNLRSFTPPLLKEVTEVRGFGWQMPFDTSDLELQTIEFALYVNCVSSEISKGNLGDDDKVLLYNHIVVDNYSIPAYEYQIDSKGQQVRIPNRSITEVTNEVAKLIKKTANDSAIKEYEKQRSDEFNSKYTKWAGSVSFHEDKQIREAGVDAILARKLIAMQDNSETQEGVKCQDKFDEILMKARRNYLIPSRR